MAPTMESVAVQQTPSLDTSVGKLSVKESETREYIFRSKLPDIELSNHLNLADYSLEKAPENLDRIAIIDGPSGKQWTYRETAALAKKVAAGLNKQGIAKGEVIALLLPNCAEFVFCLLGSATRGSVVTTCNPFYTEREIAKQLNACNTKLIVTQASFVDKVRDLGTIIITVDTPPEGALPISVLFDNDENEAPHVEINSEETVCLPYSSGTTGLPKGVMLTHKSLISSVAQQVDGENPNLYFTADDVIICLLPMFHIYSLNSVLLCSLRVCCTIVVMPKYTIPQLLEMIQKYKVSLLPVVPPVVLGIAKSPIVENYDLNSVRYILSGAAPLGKELEDKFQAKLPNAILGQGYGMTEAGPVLSMCLSFAKHPFTVKSGSCGTVVRNAQVKIVDPETGVSKNYNQPGELCIRGPQIMKGYLNNPEATANAIDKEGWLHTGDVAIIDEDEEVFIVDRVKEIIKFKGFQVPPAELEALLVSHPSIADAAVVSKADETAGEVPVAFVVRSQNATVTADEVKEFISKQVVFYKRLHAVFFVESIPKGPSGKILRKDLRLKL
ncbi:unnamed protein product [Calypogeia fissa]